MPRWTTKSWAILSTQADLRRFAAQQRIYKTGAPARRPMCCVSGSVRVTTVDEDQQEVVVNEPAPGEFFGFASMLEQTPHQTDAWATSDTECIEVDRSDILRAHPAQDRTPPWK